LGDSTGKNPDAQVEHKKGAINLSKTLGKLPKEHLSWAEIKSIFLINFCAMFELSASVAPGFKSHMLCRMEWKKDPHTRHRVGKRACLKALAIRINIFWDNAMLLWE
jgi:hypothetical protein